MANTFRHLAHVVHDMARTRKFYEEVFGFKFLYEHPKTKDPKWLADVAKVLRLPTSVQVNITYMALEGLVLELLEYPVHGTAEYQDWVTNKPGLGFISIGVTDIQDTAGKVREAGGQVLDDTFGGKGVMVKDVDGQAIEVVQDH